MPFLFTAVPPGYVPSHDNFGAVPSLEVEARADKDGNVVFPTAAFAAFVREHPGAAAYTIMDLADRAVQLGGTMKILEFAAKAAKRQQYQISERERVARVLDSQKEYADRLARDFRNAQLQHKVGCAYRHLEKHARDACTCGYDEAQRAA